MPSWTERFFGNHSQAPKPEAPKKSLDEKPQSFNIENGHAYVLLGGREEDMLTACPGCGAPFKGPCQGNCEYCSAQRKVHYADITDASILSSAKEKIENMSFILPGGDSAEFGYGAFVDKVVAEEVIADEQFEANLVITKKLVAGYHPMIETLILVDGGTADIDDQAEIGTLITGRNVGPVTLGFNTEIGRLLKTSGLRYKTGDQCKIGEVKVITQANFLEAIASAMHKK